MEYHDFIFCIPDTPFGSFPIVEVLITPAEFWNENKFMYDEHLEVEFPGLGCLQEGVYEPVDINWTREQTKQHLLSLGLVYSEEMEKALCP